MWCKWQFSIKWESPFNPMCGQIRKQTLNTFFGTCGPARWSSGCRLSGCRSEWPSPGDQGDGKQVGRSPAVCSKLGRRGRIAEVSGRGSKQRTVVPRRAGAAHDCEIKKNYFNRDASVSGVGRHGQSLCLRQPRTTFWLPPSVWPAEVLHISMPSSRAS